MDISLYYQETGSGEPLVLLHGNGEDSTYFEAQLAYFSGFYRVIAIDTRGHGRSPRGDAPFTLNQFAEDLKELLDSLELEKVNLLGFSDGGNIALLFALRYPERVKKLILNGANLNPKGVKVSTQLPVVVEYKLASVFSHFNKRAVFKKELLGLMVTQPDIAPVSLQGLDIPTLVIVGKQDMIKRSHSILIAEQLSEGKFIEIQGSHFCAKENPLAFNQAVEAFLKK